MKRILSFSLAVFCCLCFAAATERHAYGYINPGDGFMALQALFASLAAFGYYMRRRISAFFSRSQPAAERVVMPSPVVKEDTKRTAA